MIRFIFFFFLMSIALFCIRAVFTKIIPRQVAQWRNLWAELKNEAESRAEQQSGGFNTKGKMSVAEAYQVLGLKIGATKQEITDAHRKLIQKNHPDRGGSDYLAAKINLAKNTLLKK